VVLFVRGRSLAAPELVADVAAGLESHDAESTRESAGS
jgi:hypothetical protein